MVHARWAADDTVSYTVTATSQEIRANKIRRQGLHSRTATDGQVITVALGGSGVDPVPVQRGHVRNIFAAFAEKRPAETHPSPPTINTFETAGIQREYECEDSEGRKRRYKVTFGQTK